LQFPSPQAFGRSTDHVHAVTQNHPRRLGRSIRPECVSLFRTSALQVIAPSLKSRILPRSNPACVRGSSLCLLHLLSAHIGSGVSYRLLFPHRRESPPCARSNCATGSGQLRAQRVHICASCCFVGQGHLAFTIITHCSIQITAMFVLAIWACLRDTVNQKYAPVANGRQ